MASVANDPGGRRRILFVGPDGRRRTVRLGKCDRRSAEAAARHVEHLVSAKLTGGAVPRETASWLAGIGESLRDKLAAVGLVEAPKRATLAAFLDEYILNRPDVKPATLEVWRQPCRNLITFFGADRPLRDITPGEAEQFAQWLRTQKLAPTTQAKRLAFARTFFHVARKHRLIEANPFVEVKIPAADPSARQSFVSRDIFERLLSVSPPEWRVILALARLGGLRCPSEVLSLQWSHIDWDKGRITVVSPKTERYSGKASREIPLFGELRPFLEEAYELAEPGQVYVVGGNWLASAQGPSGWRNCNLRTQFDRLIRKAGLKPWPRRFHNLRSSRATELLAEYPTHVVSAWLGHGARVCLKHYAQVTTDHFERAVQGGAKSGALAAQNPAQQASAPDRTDRKRPGGSPTNQGIFAAGCDEVPDSARALSGEDGIRTHGMVLPIRRFSKPVLSTTQPPLLSMVKLYLE